MDRTRNEVEEPSHPWSDFLQRWSDEWLDPVLHEQERPQPFPDDVRTSRRLGTAGATGKELKALEARLDTGLPPSYRQFLQTSNGWLNTTLAIDRLLPTQEVGWARDIDPELVTVWGSHRRLPAQPLCGHFRRGMGSLVPRVLAARRGPLSLLLGSHER
ncbi:SMI1/KNR4 family protein [Streptomyces sp. CMB-StM0423]|uniref:SMI1/KNR4 family protein n=1 Tax=Streptomyces sp. CMB-StM0423 TaxID=2059884 RepID=UPI001F2F99E8|nr:SMI1/KNR4 family protein [Streptomyces sp. CMB-StM0423]